MHRICPACSRRRHCLRERLRFHFYVARSSIRRRCLSMSLSARRFVAFTLTFCFIMSESIRASRVHAAGADASRAPIQDVTNNGGSAIPPLPILQPPPSKESQQALNEALASIRLTVPSEAPSLSIANENATVASAAPSQERTEEEENSAQGTWALCSCMDINYYCF